MTIIFRNSLKGNNVWNYFCNGQLKYPLKSVNEKYFFLRVIFICTSLRLNFKTQFFGKSFEYWKINWSLFIGHAVHVFGVGYNHMVAVFAKLKGNLGILKNWTFSKKIKVWPKNMIVWENSLSRKATSKIFWSLLQLYVTILSMATLTQFVWLKFCFCIYLIFINEVPSIFVSFVDPISRLRILQWPKVKIKRKYYFFLILFLYHVILCRVGKVFKPFWWLWLLKSVRRFGCIDAICLKDFVVANAEFVVVVVIDVLVGDIAILIKC